MPRIWTSKNKTRTVTDSFRAVAAQVAFLVKAAVSAHPLSLVLPLSLALVLGGCASNSSAVRTLPSAAPVAATPAPRLPAPAPVSDAADRLFMNSNIASEASEFIRLGRESMADSSWFEASEYLDSATVHLAILESYSSLTPSQKKAVEVYQDSVREWLVEAVGQSANLGEAEDLSQSAGYRQQRRQQGRQRDHLQIARRLALSQRFAGPLSRPSV